MKNIKDITISIFAVIGFVSIITGFTYNQTQEPTNSITYISVIKVYQDTLPLLTNAESF